MRRGRWADDLDMIRAHAHNGVIRSAVLGEMGLAPATIAARCLPGGPWQRILPGYVLLHNGSPTQLERAGAALMYGGDDSMLTGHVALAAHGYRRSASMNDVLMLVPASRKRASTHFVTVERTWRPPEPVLRGTLRCAPVTRAVLDASRRMRSRDACRALLAAVIQRGDTSIEELAMELAEGTTHGTALPRSVLRELTGGAHSVGEVHAQRLYRRSGLPTIVHNREIETHRGEFIAIPDGWIDDVAMAWEIDSLDNHFTVPDHEATLERRERMQSFGIIVVTHLPRTIRDKPDLVIRELRSSYELARSRARPSVRLRADRSPRRPAS
ncbi:hypothetical protein [Rhodococcus sp. RD6.2]|uniref:hypothetical protein n=1 Tax=Rhodococcus sp. RD6.2 TaxID=260936 RepID=UPI000678FD62|nr:hypothetical protein [Rhodococcus sp. RD6.2]